MKKAFIPCLVLVMSWGIPANVQDANADPRHDVGCDVTLHEANANIPDLLRYRSEMDPSDYRRELTRIRDRIGSVDCGCSESLFRAGQLSLMLGETGLAREALVRSIEADPTRIAAHNLLGKIAMEAGDNTVAIEHFRESLEQDPSISSTRFILAGLLRKEGRVEEAELQTELAREYLGEHCRMVQDAWADGRYEEAVAIVRSSLNSESMDSESLCLQNLGRLSLMALGDHERTQRNYLQAIAYYEAAREFTYGGMANELLQESIRRVKDQMNKEAEMKTLWENN